MALEHTNKKYGQKLSNLRAKLIEMGSFVVDQIDKATRCFDEHNVTELSAIIETDTNVNQMDIEIEESCLHLLALEQPVASDLRLITAALKISTELERIGDRVVNVCEAVAELQAGDPFPSDPDVRSLGALARQMVVDALEAFSRSDSGIVQQVIEEDRSFDALYSQVIPRLLTSLKDPAGTRDPKLVLFSKDLIEISEHAANIAEIAMFMIDGKKIAHMDTHERRSSKR